MNKERAKELGLSILLNGDSLTLLRDLLNQNYSEESRRMNNNLAHIGGLSVVIQVEDNREFILEVHLSGMRYIVTGIAPISAAPGRYVSRQTNCLRQSGQSRRTTNGVYYGSSQLQLHVEDYQISTLTPFEHPFRVAVKDSHPSLNECISIQMSLKTLRKILNKVSRESRGLFCLASSDRTWNVFSESADDDSNRFRLNPTINSNGVAGVFYNRLYDALFRKKEAVRGVFKEHDENMSITLGVTESNALMIKVDRRSDSTSQTSEYLLFESDIEALTTSELPETLPFKGERATPLMATESTLEKSIEVTEEIQVEEPTHVESETPTLTEEELTRLNLWETAYIRWAETTGQSQASYSTSPTIWFSRYMMEKLRLGESIDELDNQLLSKY